MITQNNSYVCLSWLKGIYESDGGFTATIYKGQFKPVAKISQKTNSNLLPLIKAFLTENGIQSTYDYPPEGSDRAPALRIQGIYQVKRFIDLLKKDNTPYIFIGSKQKQFLIFEKLLTNHNLTLTDKKLLLQYNKEECSDIKDCDACFIKEIKTSYKKHEEFIENMIATKSNVVTLIKPSFISGLIDGDGSYSVLFTFREPSKKWNRKRIEWQESFTFTTDKASILTIRALLSYIGSEAIINPKGQQLGGIQVHIRNQKEITNLIQIHEKFPLLGCYSGRRFNLILKYRDLKESQEIKNKDKVIKFLEEIYTVIEASSKGAPRAYTLSEAILKLDTYFL